MKTIIAILASLLLANCALTEVKPLPAPAVMTPQDQALQAVNEAQLLVGAIVDLLDEQRAAGIVTVEEYFSYEPILSDYFDKSRQVRQAIKAGIPNAAQQAELLKAALLNLHKQIAMKARQ